MNETQIQQAAQTMFLNGSGRKDVINFLTQNGISEDRVDDMATNAYLAIKDQRMQMIETADGDTAGSGNGTTSIAIGALLLVGGIVATMASNRIWYGAMIIGAVMIFKGIGKSM